MGLSDNRVTGHSHVQVVRYPEDAVVGRSKTILSSRRYKDV